VSEAPAQNASQSFADFLVRSFRFIVQNSFGGQNDATQAKSALSGPFVNESLLNWVRFLRCAEPFNRRDFILANSAQWHHTRSNYLAAQNYSAGSTLGHAASELGAAQPDLVAENEKQRRFRFQFYGVQLAIHSEGNPAHANLLAFKTSTVSIQRHRSEGNMEFQKLVHRRTQPKLNRS
jgi:hypothetical protein